MRHILCLLCLVAFVIAQKGITCDVEFRSTYMVNGAVRGTMKFVQTLGGRYLLDYPAQGATREKFTELNVFNAKNGLDTASATPYLDQYTFRTGTSCVCETGHGDTAIPFLYPTQESGMKATFESYYNKGATANGCTTWTSKTALAAPQNKVAMYFDTISFNDQGFPCEAKKKDSKSLTRSYKYSNCRELTFAAATDFPVPSGCKCGKPIDIALVLDRSSSISRAEFTSQRDFVVGFASQFEYGNLKANLAIINFKSNAEVVLPLISGVSKANVDNAVNGLGCFKACWDPNFSCGDKPTDCCCGYGTCIACGLHVGADQLATGRKFAFKLLITITDGAGNHEWSPDSTKRVACSNCDAATAKEMNYAKNLLGTERLAMYGVGVGLDRGLSMPQLISAAGGVQERVLIRADFSDLARNSLQLIGMACDAEENPCGLDCCGVCICGKCQQPDVCDSVDLCTPTAVTAGSVPPCCKPRPVSCAVNASANKCNTYKCIPATGKCEVDTSVTCTASPDPNCFVRSCVPETGLCKSTPTNASGCEGKSECRSFADCTGHGCVTVNCSGLCVQTNRNCTIELATQLQNKCLIPKCDASKPTGESGCYTETINASVVCNDNNRCTEDSCDPAVGCVNKPIICNDGINCTDDRCDRVRGCLSTPVVCSANGKVNTSESEDSTGNGNEAGKSNGNANPNAAPVAAVGCNLYFCEETTGNCTFIANECFDLNTLTLAAGIGAAALAGIIIAAVLLAFGCAGGSAYAYQQVNHNEMGAGAINNPMYKDAGMSGENPLFQQGN